MKYSGRFQQCPRCLELTMREPMASNALSRRDNSTMICNYCGNEEAMVDFHNALGDEAKIAGLPFIAKENEARLQEFIDGKK